MSQHGARLALVQNVQDAVVRRTAALRGLRPVANASGAFVSLMNSHGIGWCAAVASSRTIRYVTGACP